MTHKIRLAESGLRKIIAESIRKMLNKGKYMDYGRITFCPDDYCRNQDESEVLEHCGVKFEYEIRCSRSRTHSDSDYDNPPYDYNSGIFVEDDGGFLRDMKKVMSISPNLYHRILVAYDGHLSSDANIDWYDSEDMEED